MYLGELDGWIQVIQVVLLSFLVYQSMGIRDRLKNLEDKLNR